MDLVATTLLSVGMIGLALSTVLIPFSLAFLTRVFRLFRKAAAVSLPAHPPSECSMTLVIPVFNDAELLSRTLKSIEGMLSRSPRSLLKDIRVVVVADGCSDNSVNIARTAGAEVIVNEQNMGKWSSLKCGAIEAVKMRSRKDHQKHSLCEPNDWIGFIDCGVEWQSNFIERATPFLCDDTVVALAPAYRHTSSKFISQCLWKLEATLKRFETLAGGPVSVHGATVLYRAAPLLEAFERLGTEKWLNDDVVLPMMVRCLCPHKRIVYTEEIQVLDRSPRAPERDSTQRRRMMQGNLQWMRLLLPIVAQTDLPTFVVALRRVARVFWAYWLAFVLVGSTVLTLGTTGSAALALTLFFGALFVSLLCRASAAARASLRAPLSLLSDSSAFGGVRWR